LGLKTNHLATLECVLLLQAFLIFLKQGGAKKVFLGCLHASSSHVEKNFEIKNKA
jgi:hypothetical protein